MSKALMPVGYDSFEELRSSDFYYVDKSLLVKQLLSKKSMVTLITRPRRFGKSLNMSMLECFFDIRKDSKDLFKNLEISKETEICNKWLNKYPTVFISFKDVSGLNYDDAFGMLKAAVSDCFKKYRYLLEDGIFDKFTSKKFNSLYTASADETTIKESLYFLCSMLFE